MRKNERDICSTAGDEETLGRQYYARHTISLWISRKLSDRDLPITIDQVRGLVVSGRDQHLAMKEKALALCDLPSYAGTRPWRSAPKLIEFLKAL